MPVRRLALVVLLVPALADARGGHSCRETADVVGLTRCSRYGAWWSNGGAGLSWEAGLAGLRFDPGKLDQRTTLYDNGQPVQYHLLSIDDRPVTAYGLRLRATIGLPHGMYISETEVVAPVTGGPRLTADVIARGTTTTMDATTTGFVAQGGIAFGEQIAVDSIMLATEVVPGMRITTLHTAGLPDRLDAADFAFVLDVRQRAAMWVTPFVTVGVEGGVDLISRGLSVGMVVGLHLIPYDYTR